MEEIGGYDYEVVDGGLCNEFYCPICCKLKRNAVELKCQHSLCSSCLNQWENKADEMKIEFNCPQCRETVDKNVVQYNGTMNRMIQTSIQIKCTNVAAGCDWIGVISNVQEHIDRMCDFKVIKCAQSQCGVYVERKFLTAHLKTCAYQTVPCEHCGEEMMSTKLKNHSNECRLFPVTCESEGCQAVIARESITSHIIDKCRFVKIDCQYASVGCLVKSLRCKQKNHEKQSLAVHMSLLLKNNLSVHKELVHTKQRWQNTEDSLQATKEKVVELEQKLRDTKDCLQATKEEVVELKLKLDTLVEKLPSIPSTPLNQSWEQIIAVAGCEAKLALKLILENEDSNMRKWKVSFRNSVKDVQGKVKTLFDNWSESLTDVASCFGLISHVGDLILKDENKYEEFKKRCKDNMFEFDLSDIYVEYLIKYVEMEILAQALNVESDQSAGTFFSEIIIRLNDKVYPLVQNLFKSLKYYIRIPTSRDMYIYKTNLGDGFESGCVYFSRDIVAIHIKSVNKIVCSDRDGCSVTSFSANNITEYFPGVRTDKIYLWSEQKILHRHHYTIVVTESYK